MSKESGPSLLDPLFKALGLTVGQPRAAAPPPATPQPATPPPPAAAAAATVAAGAAANVAPPPAGADAATKAAAAAAVAAGPAGPPPAAAAAAAAATPPTATPPAGAAAPASPPPAPPPAGAATSDNPLGSFGAGVVDGVNNALKVFSEGVHDVANLIHAPSPATTKTVDGAATKVAAATSAAEAAAAGAAGPPQVVAATGAGGGTDGGGDAAKTGSPSRVGGGGTAVVKTITGIPVPPPLPLDDNEKERRERQALYSRQIHYSEEELKKLGKNHDFKPKRIQALSAGEDDYLATRLFREISSSSPRDSAKSNEYKPLEVDKFLEHMSVPPFISQGAIEPEGSAPKKRENEKDIVAKISKMSLGYEDGGTPGSKVEKTIEIGNCKINSLRIIDIDDIKTDTKIFISNKGLKELEDYRIELGEKIHEFVKKYSNDQSPPTFKFSSDKDKCETQIQYLFDNVESIKKIQEAIDDPRELYEEALKKAKGDNSKEEIIKNFKDVSTAPAPAPAAGAGAGAPPAPVAVAAVVAGAPPAPVAVAGVAVVAGAPPAPVAGVAVVAGAAPAPAPAPALSKEDEIKLVNEIADTILQKRLVKGKIGVEKKEGGATEYIDYDISSVRISRPKDNPEKIDIEAKGDFDATDLRYVNVCLDSKKGHYVQFQLNGDDNGKAILDKDDPKYFTKIGNGFEKKEGEKASEIKKTLRKHKINIITTNTPDTPDTANTANNNAEKTLTKIRPKSRYFGGIRGGGVDPKKITRTMIESDKVFVLGEDNSIKIGEAKNNLDIKLVKKDGKFSLEYGKNNYTGTKTGGWFYDREIKKVDLDGKSSNQGVNLKKHTAISGVNLFPCCRKSKSQDNLRLKVFDGNNNEYFELEIKRVRNNYILGGSNNAIEIVGKTTGMPKTIDVSGAVDVGSQTPASSPKSVIARLASCLGNGRG